LDFLTGYSRSPSKSGRNRIRLGRCGHRVEANQRARRYDDLTAILFRKLNKVLVIEQGARAENDCGLSAFDKRSNDRPHERARRTFDDDVGGVRERFDRKNGGLACQTAKPASMLLGILHRHGGEN